MTYRYTYVLRIHLPQIQGSKKVHLLVWFFPQHSKEKLFTGIDDKIKARLTIMIMCVLHFIQ